MTPPPRRFTRPWQIIEHDESFEITDATGQNLAFIYFEDNPTRRTLMPARLSKDEARRLAREIARLPALLRIEKGIDPGRREHGWLF